MTGTIQAPRAVRNGKLYYKRTQLDKSQKIRRAVQLTFLALTLAVGAQFVLFVHQFEGAGARGISRPPGIEGWLPIAGMMNTKYLLLTGDVPVVHPAAMVLFLTFLVLSLAMRKAFCGWLCPVGTVSEYLWKLGRATFGRTVTLPRWLDIPLRGLKYILLGLFLYAVGSMSAAAIAAFLTSPYGLVADVKMLNFFRFLSVTGAIVIAVLVLASVFIKNFWCRFLCPYGALMGIAALASPVRIRRDPVRCIDCNLCARACPSSLPVDTLIQIKSAECLGCMECVAVCPAEGALDLKMGRRNIRPWAYAAVIAVIFLGAVSFAQLTGHWHSPIPDKLFQELIPRAAEFAHP
jgi:polyferredoxin